MRRLVLAAGAAATFVLGVSAAPAGAVVIITVNQNTTTSGNLQTGRLERLGPTSACGAQTLAPSVIDESSSFRYVNHTFRSRLSNPVCFEVDIDSACDEIFSAAYLGTFDPANPRTNYAAGIGGATGLPAYSFTVPGGSPFGVVVNATTTTPSCGAYTVTFRSRGPWANSAPGIAGIPAVGALLTGTDADWVETPAVAQRWQRCDATGAACADIPGATGATYTVAEADLGSTLRFVNDATDVDGTNEAQSSFVEPYIPFETREESLTAGDRVQAGVFVRNVVESRCGVPTTAPAILQPASNFLYDTFAVRSLLNEPVCLVARTDPACIGGVSPAIYDPAFAPAAGLAANYAGNSGVGFAENAAASVALPPGAGREVAVSHGSATGSCDSYALVLGADAPFASARPALSGEPAEGGTLTASDGAWSGAPALTRSWLRCDAAGAACAPIPGASGASYTPTAADAGSRLRVRVTATQGRAVSSDSDASGVVAAAPPDVTAPRGTLRLGSRNLRRALKRGRIPIRVTCDEACLAVVQLRVTRKLAKRLKLKRKVVIARGEGAVAAGRTTTLRAKLARRARRALRGRRTVRFTIAATLTDAAGNASRPSKKAALKHPRGARRSSAR